MNRKTLLIIGAGKHQIHVIQTATRMGFYTLVVDLDPEAEGFCYCDEKWVQSAYDYASILDRIESTGRSQEICGVITQAARGCILTVSKISEKLSLPHLNVLTAQRSLQKGFLSKQLNPDVFIGSFPAHASLPVTLQFPYVVKFEETSGGEGVHLITSQQQLDKLQSTFPANLPLIVEKYVQGRHFGVVGYADDSKVYTYGIIEKFHNTNLTLDTVICPADITSELQQQISHYTQSTLNTLDFDFGPFQLELIISEEQKPFFVELEPSLLGSYISELMLPMTSSVDMIPDMINLTCDELPPHADTHFHLKSVLKYHYPDETGVLQGFNLEQINRRVLFKSYINSGDQIVNTKLYIANSFLVGKNIEELKKTIHNQLVQIRVQQ